MASFESNEKLLRQTLGSHFDEEIDYKQAELHTIEEVCFERF